MPGLPEGLTQRARAYLAGEVEVVAPRDATTVVLLRDADAGLEVYLLRRTSTMAFAAGMHVFPGGSVDPRDAQHSPAWAGPDLADWAAALGCDEPLARALVCAAVRETFEESGVLLAGAPDVAGADTVVPDTTGADWEADRQALLDRSQSLAGLVEARGLVVRSDLLRAWTHWVTPEFEPRRFDTRFFVAAVPAGQRARDISGEADEAVWLPVAEAVAGYEASRLPMLPPTIVTLRELSAYREVAEVLAAPPSTLTPVMPRPVLDGERLRLVVDLPDGERDAAEVVRRRG